MILVRSSSSRIARQTWSPLIFGKSRSQTIASGRFAKARSMPALPSSASITSQPCLVKRRATLLRLSTSSSMSNTVGMACSAGLCQSRLGKQALLREGLPPFKALKQTRTETAGLPALPAQIGMEIDLLRRHVESHSAEQIGNAFAAFHGFLQASREKLDVFLVGFESQLPLREMLGQR